MYNATAVRSLAAGWKKALSANYAGSFPTVNPDFLPSQAGARPTVAAGQALLDLGTNLVPAKLHLLPFGAGSAGNQILIRVWGFRACVGGFAGTLLWAGTATLCTQVGTAGFAIVATDKYADTITTSVGTESIDCRTLSPGGNLPGKVMLKTAGCEFLIVDFDKNTATNANALWAGE